MFYLNNTRVDRFGPGKVSLHSSIAAGGGCAKCGSSGVESPSLQVGSEGLKSTPSTREQAIIKGNAHYSRAAGSGL